MITSGEKYFSFQISYEKVLAFFFTHSGVSELDQNGIAIFLIFMNFLESLLWAVHCHRVFLIQEICFFRK